MVHLFMQKPASLHQPQYMTNASFDDRGDKDDNQNEEEFCGEERSYAQIQGL